MSTSDQRSSAPIFIHSLWRCGSTYVFNAFRRSPGGYWVYQEPIHEAAFAAINNPDTLLGFTSANIAAGMRHPELNKPYFQELFEIHEHWKDRLSKPIIYDQYFADTCTPGIDDYVSALLDNAKGRPVIQECRTSSRIGALKKRFGGTHLYLWRNPPDQWWSFKINDYFDTACQLVLNAAFHPEVIDRLRAEIKFEEFHDPDIFREFEFFRSQRFSAESSYLLFYILWALALTEGMSSADLCIDMDRLSVDDAYQERILEELGHLGVDEIDLTDCHIHQGTILEHENEWFSRIESRAHGLLMSSGWSSLQVEKLIDVRKGGISLLRDQRLAASGEEDIKRARQIAKRLQDDLATHIHSLRQQHRYAEQALLEKINSLRDSEAEQALAHAERERALQTDLSDLRETLARTTAEAAERERCIAEVTRRSLDALRDEAHANLKELVRRERAFTDRLAQVQEAAQSANAEQVSAHAEREQILQADLAALREALAQAAAEATDRERRVADLTQRSMDTLRCEAQAHLKELVDRERAFAERLAQVQHEAQQAAAEHARDYAERERVLERELTILRETLIRVEKEALVREQKLHEEASQTLEAMRAETHEYLCQFVEQERLFTEQLAKVQRDAQQDALNQFRLHVEQEQTLRDTFAERERALQEQIHAAHAEQYRLARESAERVNALGREIASLANSQQLLSLQHTHDIDARETEIDHLNESVTLLKTQVTLQFEAQQRASHQLREALSAAHGELQAMRTSLSWRLTAPIRKLTARSAAKKGGAPDQPSAFSSALIGGTAAAAAISDATPDTEQHVTQPISLSASMNIAQSTEAGDMLIATTLQDLLSQHDKAFIRCAYRTLLGREPDPEGYRYYLARLRQGFSKLSILAQLRRSDEGAAKAVSLSGLDTAIQSHRWMRVPILGAMIRLVSGDNSSESLNRKLRSIENQLFVLAEETNRQFESLDRSVASLHTLVVNSVARGTQSRNPGEPTDSQHDPVLSPEHQRSNVIDALKMAMDLIARTSQSPDAMQPRDARQALVIRPENHVSDILDQLKAAIVSQSA